MTHVIVAAKQNFLAQTTGKSRSMGFRHGWIQALKHYRRNTASVPCVSLSMNFRPCRLSHILPPVNPIPCRTSRTLSIEFVTCPSQKIPVVLEMEEAHWPGLCQGREIGGGHCSPQPLERE